MAGTTGRGNLPALVWPGIKEIWGMEYMDYKPLYNQFYTKKKATLAFEKEQGVTSLPLAGIKDEGSDLAFVHLNQGFVREYTMVTYAVGTTVTREMMEDDLYGVINKLPKLLAKSMYQTEETVAHNVVNNGHTAQGDEADGVAIFATNHPLVGQAGGTSSNTLQTASDLNQTALEQACIDISDFVDDQSLKIRCYAKKLVVPTALQFVAEKILQTKQEVGSGDNTMNPMYGKMSLLWSPYLTDNDQWTIITDCDDGFTFYTRREADVERDNDFDTQNLKFSTSKRYQVGLTNWRGTYGSPGSG